MVFGDLKINYMYYEALARAYKLLCWTILVGTFGVFPPQPNTKKLATLVLLRREGNSTTFVDVIGLNSSEELYIMCKNEIHTENCIWYSWAWRQEEISTTFWHVSSDSNFCVRIDHIICTRYRDIDRTRKIYWGYRKSDISSCLQQISQMRKLVKFGFTAIWIISSCHMRNSRRPTLGAFPHTKKARFESLIQIVDYFCACPHRPKKAAILNRDYFLRVSTQAEKSATPHSTPVRAMPIS